MLQVGGKDDLRELMDKIVSQMETPELRLHETRDGPVTSGTAIYAMLLLQ